ncbi:MAG TPA: PAS domain-containing protein, partial [Candidatus Dormibacteraeota bacterium]|nr:PAS domain-containing protein [Candidatus Dormibacteraeota bacterium]
MSARATLRLCRGRARASDAEAIARHVPSWLGGPAETIVGIRDEDDGIEVVGLIVEPASPGDAVAAVEAVPPSAGAPAIAPASRDDAPDGAAIPEPLDLLSEVVTFGPPEAFELVTGRSERLERGLALRGRAIAIVRIGVAPPVEAAVIELIERQQAVLEADGLIRALFVGRRLAGDGVDLAAVGVWPDRDAIASFLADRPEGPGLDPRLGEAASAVRFEVFDLVDPTSPRPSVGTAAVLVLDRARIVVDASRGAQRVLDVPAESLIGRRFDDLVEQPAAIALEAAWSAARTGDGLVSVALRWRQPPGPTFIHRISKGYPAPELAAVLVEPAGAPLVADPLGAIATALTSWGPRSERTREARVSDRTRPRLVTLPSSDHLFSAFVARALDKLGVPSIRRLQLHLRGLYPHAVIHRRELAGEDTETWYVFRDGRVRGRTLGDRWWLHEGIANATVGRDGRIVDADERAAAAYGLSRDDLIGRDVRTLGVAGSYEDFSDILALTFDRRSADSTVRLVRPTGEPLDVAFHAEREGDNVRFALTPLPAETGDATWFAPICLPSTDHAFIARVEALCSRLAPHDPAEIAAELAVRLHI